LNALQILGWIGNVCFFSRFLIQWVLSERAHRSLAPSVFWWLSLVGTLAVAIYSASLEEYVLLLGFVLNATIYVRNLCLQRRKSRPDLTPSLAAAIAVAAIAALIAAGLLSLRRDPEASTAWMFCAAVGQAIWSSRFVVQWWESERTGVSHFPRSFWWLSLMGNGLMLAYAVHLGDAIFITAFIPGPLVQVRNLMLQRRAG
jgi:lipid-A-disaccharide synthase-like uncharacterized protein